MKKLIVKDRKLAKKLEDRLIKKGLVVAICEGEENSPLLKKAQVVIEISSKNTNLLKSF
jgi:hypothetical protein